MNIFLGIIVNRLELPVHAMIVYNFCFLVDEKISAYRTQKVLIKISISGHCPYKRKAGSGSEKVIRIRNPNKKILTFCFPTVLVFQYVT